jgi:hypothetical protein
MEVRSVGVELFHGLKQADRHGEASSRVTLLCEHA